VWSMRSTPTTAPAPTTRPTGAASTPHSDQDRVPLGDVSANTVLDPDPTDAPAKKMAAKKAKAKSTAKKGAKGRKANAAQEDDAEAVDAAPVTEDERQAAGSPASDAAVEELADQPTAGTFEQHARRPIRCAANRGV
jgi:hypothetical protein